jgi:hypothetical protein
MPTGGAGAGAGDGAPLLKNGAKMLDLFYSFYLITEYLTNLMDNLLYIISGGGSEAGAAAAVAAAAVASSAATPGGLVAGLDPSTHPSFAAVAAASVVSAATQRLGENTVCDYATSDNQPPPIMFELTRVGALSDVEAIWGSGTSSSWLLLLDLLTRQTDRQIKFIYHTETLLKF